HLDIGALTKLLEPREPQEDEKVHDKAVTAQLKGYSDILTEQMKQALASMAGYNGSQYTAFSVEYERQKKSLAITEDVGDANCEITVEMPGEIVDSNAESKDRSTVKWSFEGGAVRDREMELLVTSRVPN